MRHSMTTAHPDTPDVDLFLRNSGEQRTSNFLMWHAAYVRREAELWRGRRCARSGGA